MPAELIEGGDIVGALVEHLTAELPANGDTGPVASRQRAGGGVVLYDTGGPGFDGRIIDRAQITVDVRRPTEGSAWRTASLVRAIIHALPGHAVGSDDVFVQRVDELARPALLPDPDYDGARYRWSAFIHTRARVR